MLRFFRQYSKYMLAFFCVALMFVFLIEIPLNKIGGGGGRGGATTETLGHIGGRAITNADIRMAASDHAILRSLSPVLSVEYLEEMQWVLMLADADRLGLSASRKEAEEILKAAGVTDGDLRAIMKNQGVTLQHVFDSVRNWSIVQQYQNLALGLAHTNTVDRLAQTSRMVEMFRGQIDPRQVPSLFLMSAGGTPVSEPMLKRVVYDQRAEAKITAAEIPASLYQSEIKPPPKSGETQMQRQA